MEAHLEILEAQALKLSTPERARLAERLIASLDEDVEIEEAWAAEVERRISEIESGRVQMIPADEAIARARESWKHRKQRVTWSESSKTSPTMRRSRTQWSVSSSL